MEWKSNPVLGIIDIPALDECLHAVRGSGAWHTRGAAAPRQVHVSAVSSLAESLFLTSEVASFSARSAATNLRPLASGLPAGPHLGRLLRLFDGRDRPGRTHGRSDHERLGRRRRAADHRRGRRHLHRLAMVIPRSTAAKAWRPMATSWPKRSRSRPPRRNSGIHEDSDSRHSTPGILTNSTARLRSRQRRGPRPCVVKRSATA